MSIRFLVDHAFTLPSLGMFVLCGDMLEGTVRMGMVVTAGPTHRPAFREAITSIEFADERVGGRSWIALGFRYLHSQDGERWREMEWAGATLEIPAAPILHHCPCCAFRTLPDEERGSYDICDVCGWEDDLVQYRDPEYRGGANGESLNEARAAFRAAHPHLTHGS
ncbi:MAG TPA: CPCC family cysteine-rich protein [Longimicrobium sp.]|nr:CPCC family cysteine-rich protein [Longimicrobium sp.]